MLPLLNDRFVYGETVVVPMFGLVYLGREYGARYLIYMGLAWMDEVRVILHRHFRDPRLWKD